MPGGQDTITANNIYRVSLIKKTNIWNHATRNAFDKFQKQFLRTVLSPVQCGSNFFVCQRVK